MRKPFLFSIFDIPNVAPLPIQKKTGSFPKKQDLRGVPKIVKNGPEIFKNSWSTNTYKSYLNTKITHDEVETCRLIPVKTEKAQIMGVQ